MVHYIEKKIIIKYFKNKIILISHGGVGSEYLTKLLDIKYPNIILYNNKSLKGSIVHFPYPPPMLNKVIYIYGDIFNSILSQIPRHYDNAAKLCNNINYTHFHSLEELINCLNYDPFNIEKQILRFMNDSPSYPIILLKYGFDKSLIPILIKITNNKKFINYKFIQRENNFDRLYRDLKEKLYKMYNKTNLFLINSPQLIIRFPKSDYKLTNKDVINYKVKNNFPGKRIKHYKKINNYEIYNERDCEGIYGRLRIKNDIDKKFSIYTFEENGINIKNKYGGVEDPRYFIFNNKTYILMNGLDNNNNRNMYLYNLEDKIFCKLFISNYDISIINQQKNWTPYIHLDELYFIYSFDELCILKINNIDNGECLCIKGNPYNHNDRYKYFGSTPLIQWNYPNYIGYVHTRYPFHPCPIIYNAEKLEINIIGYPIIFKNPINIKPWRGRIVQFPYDLTIKNKNIILSVEFEDKCPTLIYIDYIGFCKSFSLL